MKVNPSNQTGSAQSVSRRGSGAQAKGTDSAPAPQADNLTLSTATTAVFTERTEKVAELSRLVGTKDYTPQPAEISHKLVTAALSMSHRG